jgi:Holliday junction resolvase RusA-like endonuclease
VRLSAADARKLGITVPPEPPAAPGVVVAEGVVEGRAVPWKSPPLIQDKQGKRRVAHWDRGYKAFVAWQKSVHAAARLVMGRRAPYGGRVAVEATFYLRPNGRTEPDTDNLAKSFVDGLQGAAIVNDVAVIESRYRKVMSTTEAERVVWRITAAAS